MLDSAIIEVIIGLVFTFILLSIICSGITEYITAKLLSLRSKNLQEALKSILADENILNTFNEHPLIKGLTKPGNYPSYIPSDVFARVLLDIVRSENPTKTIDLAVDSFPNEYIKKLLRSLELEAQGDLTNLQKNLSAWYGDSMERFSGWYQRKAQTCTYIVAIVVVIVLNVDTLTIAKRLWIDKDLRQTIVQSAEKQVSEQESQNDDNPNNKDHDKEAKEARKKINEAYAQLSVLRLPIGWDFGQQYYITYNNSIINLKTNKDLQSENCYNDLTLSLIGHENTKFNSTQFSSLINPANPACGVDEYRKFMEKHEKTIKDYFKTCSVDNVFSIIKDGVIKHWLGWIFTAIAVSLGAPFWFDILNKIVNARTAGKKPQEESKEIDESKKEHRS